MLAAHGPDGDDAQIRGEIERSRLVGGADDIDVVAVAVVGGQMPQDVFGDAVGAGEGGEGFASKNGDLHGAYLFTTLL